MNVRPTVEVGMLYGALESTSDCVALSTDSQTMLHPYIQPVKTVMGIVKKKNGVVMRWSSLFFPERLAREMGDSRRQYGLPDTFVRS